MEEALIKSVDNLGGFFHLYVITFASYGLIGIILLFNRRYYGERSALKFLDMNIYSEYFSLIFGLLFFAAIIVFHLMLLNIQTLITEILSEPDGVSIVKKLRYGSWIGSPFSKGKSGPAIFTFMISIGILYSLFLAKGHLLGKIPEQCKIPNRLYRIIGGFDLIVFLIAVYWFYLWRGYIILIRSNIGA